MMYQNGAPANIQANIYAIDQSVSNLDIVYVVSEAGGTLFKSIDKGDNWASVTDDIHFSGPREIEIDPTNPDILFIGSQHYINKSTDGGINWTVVTNGWPNETSISNYGGRLTVSDGFSNIIYAYIGANWAAAPTAKDGIKIMKSSNAGDS